MIITDYTVHSRTELFDVIRKTSLLGDSSIRPFKESKLSIQNLSYRDLVPTQTFVLRDQLANIHDIYCQMLRHGVNVFLQDGFLSYKIDRLDSANYANEKTQETTAKAFAATTNANGGLDSTFVFTPPIIEIIDNIPLLIDGQHRITYAADHNMTFNALIIENIDRSVWPYQLPIKGGWDAVQRFDDHLPDGFVRKERRYPGGTHKYYFREYPFPGIIKLAREHTGR